MSQFLDDASNRLQHEMELELGIELDEVSPGGISKNVAAKLIYRMAKNLPILVSARVGHAHATIYTQEQMEDLLIEFATQLMLAELYDP